MVRDGVAAIVYPEMRDGGFYWLQARFGLSSINVFLYYLGTVFHKVQAPAQNRAGIFRFSLIILTGTNFELPFFEVEWSRSVPGARFIACNDSSLIANSNVFKGLICADHPFGMRKCILLFSE